MIADAMTKNSESFKEEKQFFQEIFLEFSATNWFVCWKTKSDEYGGIGLTFSTMFNSESRRGLEKSAWNKNLNRKSVFTAPSPVLHLLVRQFGRHFRRCQRFLLLDRFYASNFRPTSFCSLRYLRFRLKTEPIKRRKFFFQKRFLLPFFDPLKLKEKRFFFFWINCRQNGTKLFSTIYLFN